MDASLKRQVANGKYIENRRQVKKAELITKLKGLIIPDDITMYIKILKTISIIDISSNNFKLKMAEIAKTGEARPQCGLLNGETAETAETIK